MHYYIKSFVAFSVCTNIHCKNKAFHLILTLGNTGSLSVVRYSRCSGARPFMGRLACIWITVAFSGSNIFKFLLCSFLTLLFIQLFLALFCASLTLGTFLKFARLLFSLFPFLISNLHCYYFSLYFVTLCKPRVDFFIIILLLC